MTTNICDGLPKSAQPVCKLATQVLGTVKENVQNNKGLMKPDIVTIGAKLGLFASGVTGVNTPLANAANILIGQGAKAMADISKDTYVKCATEGLKASTGIIDPIAQGAVKAGVTAACLVDELSPAPAPSSIIDSAMNLLFGKK